LHPKKLSSRFVKRYIARQSAAADIAIHISTGRTKMSLHKLRRQEERLSPEDLIECP